MSCFLKRRFWGRCPSGQREQTVNLPAYAFGGSNPSLPTVRECSSMVEPQPSKLVMSVRSRSLARVAYVAQSVEHFLGKEEVIGSNPIVSTRPGAILCDDLFIRARVLSVG